MIKQREIERPEEVMPDYTIARCVYILGGLGSQNNEVMTESEFANFCEKIIKKDFSVINKLTGLDFGKDTFDIFLNLRGVFGEDEGEPFMSFSCYREDDKSLVFDGDFSL